ncbi:MAG: phosphoribosylformylglycinamidine synthase subunit PurS [Candidatus Omnitrophica bacterium]|nr:phosphoribosylformylglycinamidine synthase subunit PurS [Candidatus Omnitrophota bacterium]
MKKKDKWLVEVFYRPEVVDGQAEAIKKAIEEESITSLEKVSISLLYRFSGQLDRTIVTRIAKELLVDRISQLYRLGNPRRPGAWSVQVWYKLGVTDAAAETTKQAIFDLGLNGPVEVATGRCYFFWGNLNKSILTSIAQRVLANALIEDFQISSPWSQKK